MIGRGTIGTLLFGCGVFGASAAPLTISPTLIDLSAPAAATTITLRGDGEDQEIQTRIMRWRQVDGVETLEPATDVVASPPIVEMTGKQDYIVRIVRTKKAPIEGEENYRILIDQLPQRAKRKGLAISFLVRQSIPAFLHDGRPTPANVTWALARRNGVLQVAATNSGDDRLRIAGLKLRDATGKTVTLGTGLIGYVLGHSTMAWSLPKAPQGFGSIGGVKVEAVTQNGPLNATAY